NVTHLRSCCSHHGLSWWSWARWPPDDPTSKVLIGFIIAGISWEDAALGAKARGTACTGRRVRTLTPLVTECSFAVGRDEPFHGRWRWEGIPHFRPLLRQHRAQRPQCSWICGGGSWGGRMHIRSECGSGGWIRAGLAVLVTGILGGGVLTVARDTSTPGKVTADGVAAPRNS